MATKFYVVWQGKQTGIFTDWDTCRRQVEGFAGAKYKSFKTRAEAEAAFRNGPGSVPKAPKATPRRSSANAPKTFSAAEVAEVDARTKIFSDGGCEPNPGKAGSGLAVYRDGEISELWFGLYNPRGTNNTAELNALHQALLLAERELESGSVAIFSDSRYSIQCVTQWAYGWAKKGWKKQGGEIKNLELIQEMFALYNKLKGRVQVLHVNGHVGVEGNELADRMSIHTIDTKATAFTRWEEPLDVAAILAKRTG